MPETQVPGSHGGEDTRHVLDRIVESKRAEIARLMGRESELRSRAADAPAPRDFRGALARPARLSLIAEVKRRSPGAGAIRPDLDPVELAGRYASGGASALSVLTDGPFFQGELADLTRVRDAVTIPCLRKDFILDERQVWEARGAGADAVLLIVRILDDEPLRALRELAEDLGMSALVEVHDADEMDRALDSGAAILGINNRDLSTFRTDLDVTLGLLDRVPHDAVLVSESGIRTSGDATRLAERGVDAILVGEAMVRAVDPGALARELTPERTPRSRA